MLMQLCAGDEDLPTPIWDEYKKVLVDSEGENVKMGQIERFAFYERAKTAYANLIIEKGVIK